LRTPCTAHRPPMRLCVRTRRVRLAPLQGFGPKGPGAGSYDAAPF